MEPACSLQWSAVLDLGLGSSSLWFLDTEETLWYAPKTVRGLVVCKLLLLVSSRWSMPSGWPPCKAERSCLQDIRVLKHVVSFCLLLFWKIFTISRFIHDILKIKLWGFYTLHFRSDTNTNSILEELWRSGLIQWTSKSFWKWV